MTENSYKKVNKKKIDWPSFKIIKTYPYRDEKNVLRHQTIRGKDKNHSKIFLQRQPKPGIKNPDDNNKNHWLWNLKGITVLPYRLPELIKGKDPVYLVEGEKDCDALREWGLTATCNPMGGMKWKIFEKDLNSYLKGRDILIMPDNDQVGEKHLIQVAESLQGITKSFKVLRLPDAKDFSEWLEKDKNNTEEKFLTLKFKAKEWKPEEKKKKKKKKKKVKNQGKIYYLTETLVPGLIHLVKNEKGQIEYLLKNEKGKLEIVPYIESYDKDENENPIRIRRKPKQTLPIEYIDKNILETEKDIDFKKLFNEVVEFIQSYLELPKEEDYLLLALWIFHTYLIEKSDVTPLLYFYGVKITGKSRAGEVLQKIAYFCERLTTPTEATLFRSADYFKTALVIDELKLWGKDANKDVATLILSRYKRGISVSRCNVNKNREDMIEHFDVFGALAICSTESVPDTIESRCLVFLMQKNINAEVEQKIDITWAAELRKKLTLFRVKYLDVQLSELKKIARRRLQEILSPLQQIQNLINPEDIKILKEIAKSIEKSIEEEEASTLEAEIVENIKYYHDLDDPYFLTKELTNRVNEDRSEKERYTERTIAFRVKRLGFKRMRTPAGHRGWSQNKKLLEKLLKQFSIKE